MGAGRLRPAGGRADPERRRVRRRARPQEGLPGRPGPSPRSARWWRCAPRRSRCCGSGRRWPGRTPRVISVTAHCVLRTFFGGPLGWLRKTAALDPEEEAALRLPPPSPAAGPVALDAADESLLAALRRDGRATLAELEAATGQSAAAIGRRLERLRTAGVLYFAVEYDREPLGQGVEAMCWLTCAPYALAEAGQAVAGHGEVRFAAAVTGRANLAVLVLCRTTGDLYTYLSERLGGLTGVQSVETTLALRRVKALTYAP
ncbi:Lrp/AsnC family transcriptional regulator [Nonomuraea wenchangensis]|uniref:Lrp/AsnC family transcriptional regulator n=1 Tax=Nonomuraea wenchangensis TaxID=568860 RepID=UPI0038506809